MYALLPLQSHSTPPSGSEMEMVKCYTSRKHVILEVNVYPQQQNVRELQNVITIFAGFKAPIHLNPESSPVHLDSRCSHWAGYGHTALVMRTGHLPGRGCVMVSMAQATYADITEEMDVMAQDSAAQPIQSLKTHMKTQGQMVRADLCD
ncbi:hypothetical protein MHYP_G00112070 [Metynnis hypsauchen]